MADPAASDLPQLGNINNLMASGCIMWGIFLVERISDSQTTHALAQPTTSALLVLGGHLTRSELIMVLHRSYAANIVDSGPAAGAATLASLNVS